MREPDAGTLTSIALRDSGEACRQGTHSPVPHPDHSMRETGSLHCRRGGYCWSFIHRASDLTTISPPRVRLSQLGARPELVKEPFSPPRLALRSYYLGMYIIWMNPLPAQIERSTTKKSSLEILPRLGTPHTLTGASRTEVNALDSNGRGR